MLIIVEGTDGGGKTTVVKRIAEQISAEFPDSHVDARHCGIPQRHPLDEYEKPLYDYVPGMGDHVIYDRHFLGELVYPQIVGRETLLDRAVMAHINMFLRARGAVLLVIDTSEDAVRARLARRGETVEQINAAVRGVYGFRDALRGGVRLLPTACVIPTIDNVDNIITTTIAAARRTEQDVAPLAKFTTYVGPPRPRYLLLGDVRHAHRHGSTSDAARADRSPSFAPYPATSGHFLLSHLPSEILSFTGLANACDVDDVVALREALEFPKTLPLGRRAIGRLTQLYGEWIGRSVSHPQYVRRFQYDTGTEYGRLIQQILTEQNVVNE